ncbi:MAG: FKBP-type peptidyl-prolyl cis-trans isomerase [Planctomycetota bacterium]|nr:FKBP-type peptidyl-prolyl cis-trans isomerase [Planctomycetota bacterium]
MGGRLLLAAVPALLGLGSCSLFRPKPPTYDPIVTASGLEIQDLVVPEIGERTAASGDEIAIHYEGRLQDGTVFDSSYTRGEPIEFELGAGQVPAGLDEGIVGMRVFGRRRLTVPPHLGYGAEGVPDRVPPNAVLVFELELLEIAGLESGEPRQARMPAEKPAP